MILLLNWLASRDQDCANLKNSKWVHHNRNILSNIDVSKSSVTGSGIVSPIIVNQTNNVLLTARDSLGNDVGVGGETIFVMIANECTRSRYMSWTPVSGATTVVANTIIEQMTDNSDGTYSYSYSLSVPGKVTISVVVAVRQGVAGEYFDNPSLTPPSVQNLTTE